MSQVIERGGAAQQPNEFSLATLLDVFVLYRRMMARILGTIVFIGISWAFLSDPVYQADILLQVVETNPVTAGRSPFGDLAAMFDMKSSADTEMQVLASRLVLAATVNDLHLDVSAHPVRFPVIGDAISRFNKTITNPGIFGMGGFNWGQERIEITTFDVPPDQQGSNYYLTTIGGGQFRLSGPGLSGENIGKIGEQHTFSSDRGPIVLNVTSISAKPGARFELLRQSQVDTVDTLQRELTFSHEGKDTSDMLRVRLRGTDPQRITDTLNGIARFYVAQNAAHRSEEATRLQGSLQEGLPQLRKRLETAEAAYTTLRSELQSVDIDDEGKVLVQQSAANETQLTQLLQRRSGLVSLFDPEYPSVTALDQQIAILRARSGTLEQRIDRLPEQQRAIVQAEREVRVVKDLYLNRLSNIDQLDLLRAGQVNTVRVIDNAVVADRPVPMRRPLIIAVALALGLLAAVLAAYLRDMLFAGVSDLREIEESAGLKVFAAVPLASRPGARWSLTSRRSAGKRRLLALSDPGDPAIESLRSLRAALQFSMLEGKNNVVMFTSPSPLIGKSFVSSNFAVVLAAAGKRVLLIDADLRRGNLSAVVGCGASGGFADLAAGTLSLDAAICKTELANLDFMPTGSRPRNAADLLTSGPIEEIMHEIASRYDVVVLDTAPLLSVPDAAILAPLAAGNVFILARSGFTKLGELEETARRLQQVGVPVTGVILNGVDPLAGHFRYGVKYDSYSYADYPSNSELGTAKERDKERYVKT